ncbi:hypothetical protein PUN28_014756 [Cardiocondyla obscurior]|uniref:Telomere-associated protein RIF1 n=1 Tax=Cardiocondyla obscurior TaxID=286306 RepID=A0AAW2F0I7_9HYME
MAASPYLTVSKVLKVLQNGNVKETREALLFISSQAKKIESSGNVFFKKDCYKDICKLVIKAFTKHEEVVQNEAVRAFNVIVREFQMHPLHLFETMLQTDNKIRLKIFLLLELQDDNAVCAAASDGQTLNFFKHCLNNVHPDLMEWLKPMACDNIQVLTKIEHQSLSDEQKIEEDVNNCALRLLKRLYRLAAITFDPNVQMYHSLLMDKVVLLAYMGHKRQRGPALKLLQQAITTNLAAHIRKDYPDLWTQYKNNLQTTFYKRMLLLVTACEPDWSTIWNITIQLLGTDLHHGANLINNLLSIEEKAFKATDFIMRRQAFLSWKLLIDNFALDHQELATPRRIKLLCIPLNAKNSKTELIALTKLEVWWHLIIKLYKDIINFINPVIVQFLNYCFGPLGDTPLLSTKFDVVASPGKRFFKTKLIGVDALCQLLVAKEDLLTIYSPMLEERLPHTMSYEMFQKCSQSVIHSIAEALLILGQLTDKEMKNRFQLGKTLWTSLIIYVRNVKLETKDSLYRNVILVVTELINHIDKPMVRDMIFNVILSDVNCIIEKTEFHDNALPELVLKLLTSPIIDEVVTCILNYDSNTIKCLLERCVSPEFTYSSGVLGFLETIMENLKLVYDARKNKNSNELVYMELWSMIAEILTKYIRNTEINVNDNFQFMKSILSFPFCTHMENLELIKSQAVVWKNIYKEVELHSDLINTLEPNEILLDTASTMQKCLNTNKSCCKFIINCLDVLITTLDYESLSTQNEIPSIIQLLLDVIIVCCNDVHNLGIDEVLRSFSVILSTIYGYNVQTAKLYLRNCKSVIKLVLLSELSALSKEVTSTWECIVCILKRFNKDVDHELLSSYKEVIAIGMNHANNNIKSLTRSTFEIKENFNDYVVNNTSHKVKESKKKSQEKPDNSKKKIEQIKEDYVFIKTELKFDVNRLTEHQKETLKKKREDIPALYNDLSQSSSQNSQNLQQWFDIKTKHINEIDKEGNNKSDPTVQKSVNNDDKRNKVKQNTIVNAKDEITGDDDSHNNKLIENVEGNTVTTKQSENSTKKIKNKFNERQSMSKETNLSLPSTSFSGKITTINVDDKTDATVKLESVAKKLDFESQDEFSEDNVHEQRLSPSMLDGKKRRSRNSTTKMTSPSKNDKTTETQSDSSTTHVQRTLRGKIIQRKPDTNSEQKSNDDTDDDSKESLNKNKKGIKRKFGSDTESDGSVRHWKRKLMLSSKSFNDDNETSQKSDNSFSDINGGSVNPRVRNEMTRLKIDMVFDCSATNRRRSKYSDEGEKETVAHGLRKHGTSDNAKSTEGSKRSSKNDDMEQVIKKRGRPNKQESNKNVSDVSKDINKDKDIKKCNNINVNELKNADISNTHVVPTSSQIVQDINKTGNERLDKNNLKSNSDIRSVELNEPTERTTERSQNEMEDVVESSQIPNVDLKDKICSEKQCFIKINKMSNVYTDKISAEMIIDKKYVPESIAMDSDDNNVTIDNNNPCELDKMKSDSNTKTKDDEETHAIDKNLVQKADNSNVKNVILESQKTIDNLSSAKSINVTSFSSPRSSKIVSKSKSFTGRAAHMLGLVTSQTQLEVMDTMPITSEEESSIKKLKSKDTENEMSTSKKILTVKETDKIGGPSGSRQEKIFNNMRSTDYSMSSMVHSFTTLKNDGEKLSFKLNKSADSVLGESLIDKENEKNASPSREKNLPILEWSSANPPSLTASPSASILKRCRSSLPESDLDLTPKRKRVSFADPPVSKEMGYEIATAGSPQKATKSSSPRNVTLKDSSPIRFSKQTKLKFVTDKLIYENNAQDKNCTEVVAEIEKTNESSTKISEACSETTDINEQKPDESVKSNIENIDINSCVKMHIDELELAQEIEISTDAVVSEDLQIGPFKDPNKDSNSSPIDVGMEDFETQQDIFDGLDTKINVTTIQTNNNDVIRNTSTESIKCNVADDSVIAALPTKDNSASMEDTIDIQNITGLNSTINTDEIFCEKPIRSSTRAIENIAEQDTVSVTDSIFNSLSTIQDTPNQENSSNIAQLNPEFLDSTQPIYSTLSSCTKPISSIIEQLTYPLWKRNLSTYFANRSVHTIGDLAQLSEREIYRLPVKGNPKTEFIKKVLERFESTCMLQTEISEKKLNEVEQLPITDEMPIASITGVSDIQTSTTIGNELLTCSTPVNEPTKKYDNLLRNSSTEDADKTQSVTSDIDISIEPTISDNPDLSDSDTSKKGEQKNLKIPIATKIIKSETSVDNVENVLPPSSFSESIVTTSEVASSSNANLDSTQTDCPAASSSAYDEISITHSSIGTITEINSATSANQKSTKSTACQMELADLLDEIDVNLVMESAVRRSSPETILSQYKVKMAHLTQRQLLKETILLLGNSSKQVDDVLKTACFACGVNRVLVRLPDIFNYDKQFFDKVFKCYNKKLNSIIHRDDFLNNVDFNELKSLICEKCTSFKIAEVLMEKVKQEQQQGMTYSKPDLSSLNAMLKMLPMDVIVKNILADTELIPAPVLLNIALQNNSSGDIAEALQQSTVLARRVSDKLWTSQLSVAHIENNNLPKESLLNIFKSICSKLPSQDLLNAYHEAMTKKLDVKNVKNTDEKKK